MKALTRHADAIEPLRRVAMSVGTTAIQFDILQLVFMDRNQESFKAIGCKNDRLFQVEVPIPAEATVDYNDALAFVGSIAQRLSLAVTLCDLPKDIELQLIGAINQFADTH